METSWILALLCLFLGLVSSFVRYQPKRRPPGPWFRIPFIGNAYLFLGNPLKNFSDMRKRYGEIFSIDAGVFRQIMVRDLEMLQAMMSKDVFSGRGKIKVMGFDIFSILRGGHGGHGLVHSEGDEWREQRRFALKHLKDFGFGKSSMEEMIRIEVTDLADYLRSVKDEEVETKQLFNFYVMNILWCMMSGCRYDLKDQSQLKRLEDVEELISDFGPTNMSRKVPVMMPKVLRKLFVGADNIMDRLQNFFQFFEDLSSQHETTFDPKHMRDFIDVYSAERQRVASEGLKSSSFYGESGRLNYVNTMFDLFLVGSETTTTFLRFLLLYMINFPSVQERVQEELDRVVGRDRTPSLADVRNTPYTEAVISEIQRHATIVPIGVNHAPMSDTTFAGYDFKRTDMIAPCLYEIHHDSRNFPEPHRFDPTRFLDQKSERYLPHPALVPYGFGKRECLGKSMAKAEVFLFTAHLLQQFTFLPSSKGAPSIDDVSVTLTRCPNPFKVRVVPRV